jgi:Ca-activated chloride channel family protein
MQRLSLAAVLPIFTFALLFGPGQLVGQEPKGAETKKDPAALAAAKAAALEKDVTQGALRIVGENATVVECPLKHTDVKADVAGFIARVKVTQTFVNPSKEKIEAVYVFPLPHESAVDDMTMVIGERKIVGQIKRRAEARTIYEQALQAGQTAALLEQERPNIFTQSVGNIEPGQEIKIEISYVDVLKYDVGTYEFHFPMVVGPRFNPGGPIASPADRPKELEGKVSPPAPDTTRVPDGSKISPPVLKPGVRNGHDISLSINLDAGVPIQVIKTAHHDAEIQQPGVNKAIVKLSPADSLPNKDFVLQYTVVGKKPEMAVLAHTGSYTDTRRLGNGYFMLMIQPKEDERLQKSPPREMVFLVDVSGSMSGEPTKKVISAMQEMLKLCREKDTVQVVTFASQANQLFEKSVPVNEANITRALNFTQGLKGGGGTHMLEGVKLAIDAPLDKERVRIIVMLTDGYIGNEAEIIEHVGKNCGDQVRFWAIGIGTSPNMFLIDGVAKQGGGMGKRLALLDDPVPLTQEVMTRIQRAQLSKVRIDWGGLPVAETFPAKIPELWAGRPVIVYGRFKDGKGEGTIKVTGSIEGDEASWPLAVTLPEKQPANDVLAKVWARQKIEDLMQQSYYLGNPAVEEEVTALALDYRLMSQYTSFVAVDEKEKGKHVEPATPPRRMLVPVPLPEGTQWEGFFGGGEEAEVPALRFADAGPRAQPARSEFTFNGRANIRAIPGMGGIGGIGGGGFGGYGLAARAKGRSGEVSKKSLEQLGKSVSRGGAIARPAGAFAPRQQMNQLKDSKSLARGLSPAFGRESAARGERLRLLSNLDGAIRDREAEFRLGGDDGYTARALQQEAAELHKAAQAQLKSAQGHLEKKEFEAARIAFAKACFLDTAAANVGLSQGDAAESALAALEDLHERQIAEDKKQLPALDKRLDLVIRDKSLSDALTEVCRAAKIEFKVLPGSVEDATQLLGEAPRVSYLDLRRATAAEALDWLLQPARLAWRLNKSTVVVASERRLAGECAWVYDVAAIALPSAKELAALGDYNKAVAAAKKDADAFLASVRSELKAKDASAVAWFAPGHVLVIGNAGLHSEASKLFTELSSKDFRPQGAIAGLYATTFKRADERKELLAKQRAAQAIVATAAAHEEFGWNLLAAAKGGKLDLEALTELEIAWKQPQTEELLTGTNAAVAFRSLWTISESARELPQEKELAALAQRARKQAGQAAYEALAALAKSPASEAALAAVIYAALAMPENADLVAKAKARCHAMNESAGAAAVPTLALALLEKKPEAALVEKLGKVLESGVAGDDLVVLAALASRRAGGETWNAFRAKSRTLLGEQPLSGSVVVLVNRL